MKKALLLSASLIALSAPAFAADLPVKAPVRAVAPLWTGLYIGAHGGYTWADTEWEANTFGSGAAGSLFSPASVGGGFTHDNDGGMAGGHIGYNWQVGGVVLGIEGSLTWADLSGSSLNPYALSLAPVPPNATYTNKLEWLTTITPRLGVVLNNNWLAYVKGGLAVGQVQTDLASTVAPGFIFSRNAPQMGWTAGAGVEYMFAPNWILGAEYNYYNLRPADLGGMVVPNTTYPIGFSEQFTGQSVLARLSYKTNGDSGPFAADPRVVAASPWSGFYVGAHAGYGFGDADRLYVPGGSGTGNSTTGFSDNVLGSSIGIDIDGAVIGLHAGGNVTFGNALLGIEAAATWSEIGGKSSLVLGAPTSTATYSTDVNWLASVTPRFGYVFGNLLGYVKGGVAVADVSSFARNSVTPFISFEGDATRLGWTAGIGIEYAWSPNWIVGIEYNYYDFDRVTLGGVTIPVASRWPVQYDEKVDLSTITARLSYKFGG